MIHTETGKRIKQRDIAVQAGVSISTVSRVLNNMEGISDDLRRHVLAAAAELGYQQGQTAAQPKLRHVHLFTAGSHLNLTLDPFHADLLAGIEAECRGLGIRLSYSALTEETSDASFVLEKLGKGGEEGVLLLSVDDLELIAQLLAKGVPVVTINTDLQELVVDSFLPDNQSGPLKLMRYLIERGHRRILHVTELQRRTLQRRHESYRAGLEEAGIAYDPSLVIDTGVGTGGVYQTVRSLLQAGSLDFSAVFCVNDSSAVEVIHALKESGRRVPEDVSVVGYDDIPIAAFLTPPLTTVRIERQQLCTLAVRRLLDQLETPGLVPIRVELGTQLIERKSVMRLKR